MILLTFVHIVAFFAIIKICSDAITSKSAKKATIFTCHWDTEPKILKMGLVISYFKKEESENLIFLSETTGIFNIGNCGKKNQNVPSRMESNGKKSWIEFWKFQSKLDLPSNCPTCGKVVSRLVGSHVKIYGKSGHYIIPQCYGCNNSKSNDYHGSESIPKRLKHQVVAVRTHTIARKN